MADQIHRAEIGLKSDKGISGYRAGNVDDSLFNRIRMTKIGCVASTQLIVSSVSFTSRKRVKSFPNCPWLSVRVSRARMRYWDPPPKKKWML